MIIVAKVVSVDWLQEYLFWLLEKYTMKAYKTSNRAFGFVSSRSNFLYRDGTFLRKQYSPRQRLTVCRF